MTSRRVITASGLRQASHRLASHAARRFGLNSSFAAGPSDDIAGVTIPRGRREPFATEEYDVLPRERYDFVARDYYSPIPNLAELPENIWTRRSDLGGINLRVDEAMSLVESELTPFIKEFDVPIDGPLAPGKFFLRNGNYESVDAELLYALLRARKPTRTLELGSGYSTLLIGLACQRNAKDGVPAEHIAYDPFPRRQILGDEPPPPTRFEAISAVDVPIELFSDLEPGDVLFVDTTHTVKLGSDVNHIILDVLPKLPSGVMVHFHDIFLPWEYPRTWFKDMQYYWAEQYLLQAFLAFNDAFEVLLPAQALAREHPERLADAIPSFTRATSPGAMWLVRQ